METRIHQTAGLSKAYAVLRQLETLREMEIKSALQGNMYGNYLQRCDQRETSDNTRSRGSGAFNRSPSRLSNKSRRERFSSAPLDSHQGQDEDDKEEAYDSDLSLGGSLSNRRDEVGRGDDVENYHGESWQKRESSTSSMNSRPHHSSNSIKRLHSTPSPPAEDNGLRGSPARVVSSASGPLQMNQGEDPASPSQLMRSPTHISIVTSTAGLTPGRETHLYPYDGKDLRENDSSRQSMVVQHLLKEVNLGGRNGSGGTSRAEKKFGESVSFFPPLSKNINQLVSQRLAEQHGKLAEASRDDIVHQGRLQERSIPAKNVESFLSSTSLSSSGVNTGKSYSKKRGKPKSSSFFYKHPVSYNVNSFSLPQSKSEFGGEETFFDPDETAEALRKSQLLRQSPATESSSVTLSPSIKVPTNDARDDNVKRLTAAVIATEDTLAHKKQKPSSSEHMLPSAYPREAVVKNFFSKVTPMQEVEDAENETRAYSNRKAEGKTLPKNHRSPEEEEVWIPPVEDHYRTSRAPVVSVEREAVYSGGREFKSWSSPLTDISPIAAHDFGGVGRLPSEASQPSSLPFHARSSESQSLGRDNHHPNDYYFKYNFDYRDEGSPLPGEEGYSPSAVPPRPSIAEVPKTAVGVDHKRFGHTLISPFREDSVEEEKDLPSTSNKGKAHWNEDVPKGKYSTTIQQTSNDAGKEARDGLEHTTPPRSPSPDVLTSSPTPRRERVHTLPYAGELIPSNATKVAAPTVGSDRDDTDVNRKMNDVYNDQTSSEDLEVSALSTEFPSPEGEKNSKEIPAYAKDSANSNAIPCRPIEAVKPSPVGRTVDEIVCRQPNNIYASTLATSAVQSVPAPTPKDTTIQPRQGEKFYVPMQTTQSDQSNIPLHQFLHAVTTADAKKLEKELESMADTCHNGTVESFVDDSLALTALMNRPDVLERLIVPLLSLELAALMNGGTFSSSRRMQQVLSAAIGLGASAESLLPLLMDCLTQATHRKASPEVTHLITLAIRTCGGQDGLCALLDLVRYNNDNLDSNLASLKQEENSITDRRDHNANTGTRDVSTTVELQCAALWGFSALARPVIGHTSVVCAGPLTEQLSYYDNSSADGSDRALGYVLSAPTEELDEGPFVLQELPLYRPTSILIDNEEARQALLCYLHSEQYVEHAAVGLAGEDYKGLTPQALEQVLLDVVSNNTFKKVHETLQLSDKNNLSENWTRAHSRITSEIHQLLKKRYQEGTSAGDTVKKDSIRNKRGGKQIVLDYSYPFYFRGMEELLFQVEHCLVQCAVRSPFAAIQEQALKSLAALPSYAREHSMNATYDFLKKYLASFEHMCLYGNSEGNEASSMAVTSSRKSATEFEREGVLVAAEIAVGVMATPRSCSTAFRTEVSHLLRRLLSSPRWVLRHGACIGLGYLGPRLYHSGKGEGVLQELVDRIVDGSVGAETVVWAMMRQGPAGLRAVLTLLNDVGLPSSTHIALARGIGDLDVIYSLFALSEKEKTSLLQEVVQSVGRLVANGAALEEEVLIDCIYSLSAAMEERKVPRGSPTLLNELSNSMEVRTDEAVDVYQSEEPVLCFEVLRSLIESAVLPLVVLKALFFCLCKYGRAHGEVYACHETMEADRIGTRSAAAFGLRACGPRIIRALCVALNDDAAEVREEAVDTLAHFGVEAIVNLLRCRPPKHRQQVCAALRDAVLRDVTKSAPLNILQKLYDTLLTLP